MNARRSDCPDDLVAQSSKEDLSELARRALAAHAANCVDCRAALALAAALHEVPRELPGDADIIDRVAASAGLAGASRGSRITRRTVGVAAAITFVCTVTAAAAIVTWSRRAHRPSPPMDTGSASAEPRAKTVRPGGPTPVPVLKVAPEPPTLPAPRRRSHRATPQPSEPATTATVATASAVEPIPAVTPAMLFGEANALRARGDLPGAANLYATLRRRFPDSREAILAAISLGKLLLAQGDGSGALSTFDAYLAQRSPGPLIEEALVGRARALKILGRGADERATWDELLKRFRGTAYESLARQRLSELAP